MRDGQDRPGVRRSVLLGLAGFLGSRAAVGTAQAAQGEARAAAVYPTLAALAEAPAAVKFALTLGHSRPGCGAAAYRRVGREPAHAGKRRGADGGWWEIMLEGEASVTQFGALGDGTHDDTPAIQAAIDYCLYVDGAPKTVRLPALRYRTEDTVHVGYGDRFVTLTLEGESGPMGETGLFPSFSDRPCLNVQGGRFVRLRCLTLTGVNFDHIDKTYDTFPDRGQREAWRGPRLDEASASRFAPYAGLTIDAYSGPKPERAYPPVAYPAFLHDHQQYGRNFSSNTLIENCRVAGFHVALAVQPGQVPDASNGDFVAVRDCDLSFNVIGIADGHTDARCNLVENTRIHFCHTAIDTIEHGPGRGQFFGPVTGSSFDNVWRLLNINIGGSAIQGPFPLSFIGCYGESIYHLGTAYASGTHAPGISFESCKFEFSIKNQEYSPRFLLRSAAGLIAFRQCVLMGGAGFFAFDADLRLDGVTLCHPQVVAFDVHQASGRLALSFTGQIFARRARGIRISPLQFFDFSGRFVEFAVNEGLDGDAFDIARDAGAPGRPLPWWVERLSDGESRFPISSPAALALDTARHRLRAADINGADYTIFIPESWAASLEPLGVTPALALGAGDLLFDFETGLAAYVREAVWSSSGEVAARVRQITGVRSRDGGRSFEIDAPAAEAGGAFAVFNARRFYPAARRVEIIAAAGEKLWRFNASGGTPELFVGAGDIALLSSLSLDPDSRRPAVAAVQEANPQRGEVTLDWADARALSEDAPLFAKGERK